MHDWRQIDLISVYHSRVLIHSVPWLVCPEIAVLLFSPWLSGCHGIGAIWQCVTFLWLGLSLELQPKGACKSWEKHSLGDLGVLQTPLVVEIISSISLVGMCSEWGWEAVHCTGFASCHHLGHGMLTLKKQSR